jgi:hypothetical protein
MLACVSLDGRATDVASDGAASARPDDHDWAGRARPRVAFARTDMRAVLEGFETRGGAVRDWIRASRPDDLCIGCEEGCRGRIAENMFAARAVGDA